MSESRTLETAGFDEQTVKTVRSGSCDPDTSLKRGANESQTHLPGSVFILRRHWEKGLAAVPFLILIWMVARYWIDVPYLDQWDFVPLIEKMYQGQLTFHDLWMQFNEHRILFPKIIMLGLARLTHWNLRYELAVSVLLAIGVFLSLAWQIRATARVLGERQLRWALPACSLVTFSASQYENFLWGWQLGLLLGLLAALGAILLLANPPFGWGKFVGATVLGIVATYSFANGVLVWVIGFGLLCVIPADESGLAARAALPFARMAKPNLVALAVWSFVATVSVWLYLQDYHRPEGLPRLTFVLNQPVVFIAYVLKYIGSTCAQYGDGGVLPDRIWALMLGLAGLTVMGWAGWRMALRTRTRSCQDGAKARAALTPYFAMCAYSLGTALMTATARGGLGRGQALCPRYCSITGPFWFSIMMMLILLSQKNASPQPSPRQPAREGPPISDQSRSARWLLFGVLAFLTFSSGFAIRSAKELSGNLANGRRFVLALGGNGASLDGAHDELHVLSSDSRTVLDGYRILSARGLSLCRNPNDE